MITKLKRVYSFADIIFGGYRNNTNMGAERYKSICRICEEKCSSMNDRCDKCQLENCLNCGKKLTFLKRGGDKTDICENRNCFRFIDINNVRTWKK